MHASRNGRTGDPILLTVVEEIRLVVRVRPWDFLLVRAVGFGGAGDLASVNETPSYPTMALLI